MTASEGRVDRVAHYSVLKYVPDPLRDEPINVGLLMVGDDGWSRAEARVPKTRLSSIGRRPDVEKIEAWVSKLVDRFDARGAKGMFRSDADLSVDVLSSWAAQFGGVLRLSDPQVAVHSNLDDLWSMLFRRLVGRQVREGLVEMRTVGDSLPAVSAAREREMVVDAVLEELETWVTFDRTRVVQRQPFHGSRASHYADLAIVNGRVTAVAQALPLSYGSETDVITSRALLLDAAIDLDRDVLKLGVYRDPPSSRLGLLHETRRVVDEANARDLGVQLQSVSTFGELERMFAPLLFE